MTIDINPGFTGLHMPPRLLFEDSLTAQERFALAWVSAFYLSGNPCFAGNEWFAVRLGLSKSRVSELFRSLEEKGFIDVLHTRSDGGLSQRYLALTYAGTELFTPGMPVHMAVDNHVDNAGISDDLPPLRNSEPPFGFPNPPLRNSEPSNIITNNKLTSARERVREEPTFEDRLRSAAGEALSPNAASLDNVIALTEGQDPFTEEEIIVAMRSAAKWWLSTRGPRSMYGFNLVLDKARERRQSQRKRSAAGGRDADGWARRGPSSGQTRVPKGKPFKVVADPNREVRHWTGPPEIRVAVKRRLGEEGAVSYLDQSDWLDGRIITHSSYAYEKLKQVDALKPYRIDFVPRQ